MKKFLSVLMAAAMLLSVCALTACGGDDTDKPADTDADADASSQTELSTVTAGKLTMSTNAAFPPYEMTDDSGAVVGIDAEIAAAIAEKLGLELQIDDMDFDGALLAAQQGKSDMVMAGVTITDDRLLVMDFSDSYTNAVQVVIIPEGSDVTLDNLGEKAIGTQRGTTGNVFCKEDYGEEHVVAYDDAIAAVQALKNGQVDCVVIDSAVAQNLVNANTGLTILDTEYANENYAIGVAKGNTALLEAINAALAELTEDGTIQTIIDKYITADEADAADADAADEGGEAADDAADEGGEAADEAA